MPWQEELEDSFPYQPTTDQLKAVQDVKRDMESDCLWHWVESMGSIASRTSEVKSGRAAFTAPSLRRS